MDFDIRGVSVREKKKLVLGKPRTYIQAHNTQASSFCDLSWSLIHAHNVVCTLKVSKAKKKREFPYLPPFCTLPRKFRKNDGLFGMFFLVLLTTCLYKESVCRHSTTRFCISSFSAVHFCSNLIILICILLYVSLILLDERIKIKII